MGGNCASICAITSSTRFCCSAGESPGSTGVGVSFGIPVGRAGTVSVGGGKSKPVETKEGTLVLQFVDAKSKALFWKATASGAVEPGFSPEEQQKRINDVIAQMLAQFPPKK